jgi:hypothetical protein
MPSVMVADQPVDGEVRPEVGPFLPNYSAPDRMVEALRASRLSGLGDDQVNDFFFRTIGTWTMIVRRLSRTRVASFLGQ